MVADIRIRHFDESFSKIECDEGIFQEIADNYTFFAENYKFDKRYTRKKWDGKIRLLSRVDRKLPKGLVPSLVKYCDDNGYTVECDPEFRTDPVTMEDIENFIKRLDLPAKFEVRDYQKASIFECISSGRKTLESPTSSGKSLMIYILTMWYATKSLIIVPSLGLVSQMADDFRDYGYTGSILLSTDGIDRSSWVSEDIVISTWQTLENGVNSTSEEWYEQFGLVFGDEAHGAKAKSVSKIISSMTKTKYKFGTTGTLDDIPVNRATIIGLFGPRYKSISTREMIDSGFASDIKIKCLVLKYPDHKRKEYWQSVYDPKTKEFRSKSYHEEVDFIIDYTRRLNFIVNLALSLEGNKIIFFKNREQGKNIVNALKKKTNKPVYYIDGTVSKDTRESIRKTLNEEDGSFLVASKPTTATGISINRLHHMIFADSSKSKIKVLQAIGRMLRLHPSKRTTYLYDIVDDIGSETKRNFCLNHFLSRAIIYTKEKFEFRVYKIRI